jgi:RHS repeat-associated protein
MRFCANVNHMQTGLRSHFWFTTNGVRLGRSPTTGISFLPTYNLANHYQTLPGSTPTYDGNGNLTADGGHNYTWDGDGNPTSIDGNGVTYDALGRMVELSFTWGKDQWVYSPTGKKIGLMLGQTFRGAWVPLPGGGYRLYQANGVTNGYRHPDWLGSARLVTSDTQTFISDTSYAPFGEDYGNSGSADLQFTVGSLGELVASATGSQGLFDFDFRKYRPAHGRWISPDPAGLGAVDPSNPQTWNRYAYVENDPLGTVDPLGLWGRQIDCVGCNLNGGLVGPYSSTYYVDGIQVSAAVAESLLGMGSAVLCPNNDCFRDIRSIQWGDLQKHVQSRIDSQLQRRFYIRVRMWVVELEQTIRVQLR